MYFAGFPIRLNTPTHHYKLNTLYQPGRYGVDTYFYLQHQCSGFWPNLGVKPPEAPVLFAHPELMLSMLDHEQAGREGGFFYAT